jgi:hypothetical protein
MLIMYVHGSPTSSSKITGNSHDDPELDNSQRTGNVWMVLDLEYVTKFPK